MITTEDLSFLLVLSRCKTMAEAARVLNVSAPSVTLRVQHMRKN